MSGKSDKKLRRVLSKEFSKAKGDAVEIWLRNLLRNPFKIRFKVAMTILRGEKYARRK